MNERVGDRSERQKVNSLTDPKAAIWYVVTVAIWKSPGFNLLLYLAALEAVPTEHLEAASLDGAGGWTLFWCIKGRLNTPTIFSYSRRTPLRASSFGAEGCSLPSCSAR